MENVIENWLNLSIIMGWFFLGYSGLILIGYHYQLRTLKRRTEQYKFASEKRSNITKELETCLAFP